jgi:hypothetical protein
VDSFYTILKDKILKKLDHSSYPGSHVQYFQSLGHRPFGLDGSKGFCRMARHYSGCQIFQQTFLILDLASKSFDGIFAKASLFQVPCHELPSMFFDLYTTLRPGGIIF